MAIKGEKGLWRRLGPRRKILKRHVSERNSGKLTQKNSLIRMCKNRNCNNGD